MLYYFEIMEQLGIIMAGFAGTLGALLLILQRLGIIFKNDKKGTRHVNDLDVQIENLKEELQEELDDETDKAHNTHVRIFDKLEELSKNIAYIRGLLKDQS